MPSTYHGDPGMENFLEWFLATRGGSFPLKEFNQVTSLFLSYPPLLSLSLSHSTLYSTVFISHTHSLHFPSRFPALGHHKGRRHGRGDEALPRLVRFQKVESTCETHARGDPHHRVSQPQGLWRLCQGLGHRAGAATAAECRS